jgi:hypothetical protein
MRFVFHNPHELNYYKTPLSFFLEKRKAVSKYSYLFDYFLETKKTVYVYIDSYKSSVSRKGYRRFLPPLIGFYAWAILNRINLFHLKVITDIKKIKQEDIIFMFLYGNFTNQDGILPNYRYELNNLFSQSKAFKVAHLTHYVYNTNIGSTNSKNANIDLFVAENNLSFNSEFFQKTFDWYKKDTYILPFIPHDKFKRIKEFDKRKNLVIATGTITFPINDIEFRSHFGHSKLQPMRSEIYENSESLLKYIDSIILPINETGNNEVKQEAYFSYDIVELYNNYKMFVVPEEVGGLPGIGFVEGMMCGSAFIGLNDPMYTDIGLKDGVNYIGYDGTLEDLKYKITYYQEHQDELNMISNNGYNFVSENFKKYEVAEKFVKDVILQSLNRDADQNVKGINK